MRFDKLYDNPTWKALKVSWRRYCANPSKENRGKYFEVAVPKWRKERDDERTSDTLRLRME